MGNKPEDSATRKGGECRALTGYDRSQSGNDKISYPRTATLGGRL